MTISQRLFALMSERGITKAQLAKGTGINPRTVGDWEIKGTNPSAEKIACICDFLGVSTNYLLTGEEHTHSNTISASVSGSAFFQGSNTGTLIVRNGDRGRELSEEEMELFRIYTNLDVKRRHKLLNLAFSLEDEQSKNK